MVSYPWGGRSSRGEPASCYHVTTYDAGPALTNKNTIRDALEMHQRSIRIQ